MTTAKKSDVAAVEKVLDMHRSMNELTVDKIDEIAPQVEVAPVEMSTKERAALENLRYIEPKRRMRAFGELPEKLKTEHKRAWEYVRGMYENYTCVGESISFWLSLYPGDPDCLWEIPANTPVYVPRMVANHLEECQKYHSFGYAEKPKSRHRPDDFMEDFTCTGTHYRGKFRPIGAFA